jgi:H+/Cl- antiporter ClcA
LRFALALDSKILALSCLVGAIAGLLATAYYWALSGLLHLVQRIDARVPVYVVMPAAGVLVGLCYLLGHPGETDAVVNNIHVKNGRIDTRANLPLVPSSLISVAAGGSAGPEAPVVYLTGSVGTWLHRWLALPERYVRTLTLTGMGVGFATLLGAPVGSALFALEIPHRRGMEYYEATVPVSIGTLVGYGVFLFVTGQKFGPTWRFGAYTFHDARDLAYAVLVGLTAGVVSLAFVRVIHAVKRVFRGLRAPMWVRAAVGGAVLGFIAWRLPATRFWGQAELQSAVLDASPTIGLLLVLAAAKMLTVSVTLASGWRGGIIIPCFFIGACLGQALARVVPGLPPTLAMLSGMAAVNVSVMKVPLGTVLVVAAMSGVEMIPPIAAATFAAFAVTGGIRFLESQRGRAGAKRT